MCRHSVSLSLLAVLQLGVILGLIAVPQYKEERGNLLWPPNGVISFWRLFLSLSTCHSFSLAFQLSSHGSWFCVNTQLYALEWFLFRVQFCSPPPIFYTVTVLLRPAFKLSVWCDLFCSCVFFLAGSPSFLHQSVCRFSSVVPSLLFRSNCTMHAKVLLSISFCISHRSKPLSSRIKRILLVAI